MMSAWRLHPASRSLWACRESQYSFSQSSLK
jgi:hypothetical protein